jgi:hypothetical protein
MSKTELQMEWERRIAIFRASGQTQSKWCQANDVSIHQLRYWLKKMENDKSKTERSTTWVSLSIDESSQEFNETLLINIGGTSIEGKLGFNLLFPAEVVRTLKSLC